MRIILMIAMLFFWVAGTNCQILGRNIFVGDVIGASKINYDSKQKIEFLKQFHLLKLSKSSNIVEIRMYELNSNFCNIVTILTIDSLGHFNITTSTNLEKCNLKLQKLTIPPLQADSIFDALVSNQIFRIGSDLSLDKYHPGFLVDNVLYKLSFDEYYDRSRLFVVEFKVQHLYRRYSFHKPLVNAQAFTDHPELRSYRTFITLLGRGLL